ncbi:probable leucine-rich repeat receptor-like protein kinase At1g35710 [Tripterygium wilfordii]|uniref:probable leucine-rich repeat receptor-like protein kinase At1g35710 n=1 Tax=Tripterygium wilfordii TaxID=458696 RepID=UPI0018F85293|nr:probable leucine-rich repeat receptor-like protein kinase At1g35710 [Tripterygium wilfordii]
MNRLEGSIPPSLQNCFKLQGVSLSINMLSGGIPEEMGTLKNLQILLVAENNLHGTIPVSIGNMSTLERFSLVDNKFTGLTTLDLSRNKLNGSVPTELGTLQKLQTLYLTRNYLTVQSPLWANTSLFNISSLRVIAIVNNSISGDLPSNMGLWLPNLGRDIFWGQSNRWKYSCLLIKLIEIVSTGHI